ncbi:MAG: LysR family transcriptional regulator ArgP [Desulfoplanes sp.]
MLDYKLLEALNAVIQEEGFDRAARHLHLTPSAISHRIRLLEEQTGHALMIRSSPPRPTPAGSHALKHFRLVQDLENDLEKVLSPTPRNGFVTLSLGVNADSLSTWFLEAIHPFLCQERILLDLVVEDQDITHTLLQNGDVTGCISAQSTPFPGCTAYPLGVMIYRLVAAPAFIREWLPEGLTHEAVLKAPAVIFNRKDGLHRKILRTIFPDFTGAFPAHYIPSSEKFVDLIVHGHGYGVVPDLQSRSLLDAKRIRECAPEHPLHLPLFWHTWEKQSDLLKQFTRMLLTQAHQLLPLPSANAH